MATTHQVAAPAVERTKKAKGITANSSTIGPMVTLVVLIVAFTVINPRFGSLENIQTVLYQAAIPLILSVGATFVILIGGIDLSIEGVMAAGALTFVLLSPNNINDSDFGVMAIGGALFVGALLGALNGFAHVRLKIPSFMSSLGVWYIGLGIASMLYDQSTPRLSESANIAWANGTSIFGISNSTFIALGLIILAVIISRWTRFGRYAYAIGGDEAVVRLTPINIGRYKIAIFMVAGICAAFAGVLGSIRLGVGVPAVGSGQLFTTISAVVLGGTLLSGGRGGILHSLIGVMVIVVLANGLVLSGVSPYVQQAVQGMVVIVAVGVAGWKQRSILRIVK